MQASLTSLLPRQRGLQLRKTAAPLTLEAALNLLEVNSSCICYCITLRKIPAQFCLVLHCTSLSVFAYAECARKKLFTVQHWDMLTCNVRLTLEPAPGFMYVVCMIGS